MSRRIRVGVIGAGAWAVTTHPVELVEAALRSAATGQVEPVPSGRPAWA